MIEQDRLIQHLSWLRGEMGYVAMDKSVMKDPRSPVVGTATPAIASVDWVDADGERRAMAVRIATAFADAGMGSNQQIAAVVNAISESSLNPRATSRDGVGLFQLSEQGLGRGFSRAQLFDPDINIAEVVGAAKRTSSFVNATNLTDAVTEFVTKVSRPVNLPEAVDAQLEIAKRAQQP